MNAEKDKQIKFLELLKTFKRDPLAATVEMLLNQKKLTKLTERMNEILEDISKKEMPEFPEIPEPKETDLSGIENTLLEIKEELSKPQKDPIINVEAPIIPEIKIPEIKIPEYKAPEFPKDISIKEPSWFSFDPIINKLALFFDGIKKHLFRVEVSNPQKEVVLVDKEGNPIDFNNRGTNGSVWMRGPDKVGIKDSTGADINPATNTGLKETTDFAIGKYDQIVLAYNAQGDIDTKTYKLSGATVAVITYAYDGSFNLTSKTRTT